MATSLHRVQGMCYVIFFLFRRGSSPPSTAPPVFPFSFFKGSTLSPFSLPFEVLTKGPCLCSGHRPWRAFQGSFLPITRGPLTPLQFSPFLPDPLVPKYPFPISYSYDIIRIFTWFKALGLAPRSCVSSFSPPPPVLIDLPLA